MNDKGDISPVIGVVIMVGITVGLAAVIALFVFGVTGHVSHYTPENYDRLEKTIDKYEKSEEIANSYTDNSGNLKVIFRGAGMAEIYVVPDSNKNAADRMVFGGDGKTMDVVQNIRPTEGVKVYTFICSASGKTYKSTRHVYPSDLYPPVEPNNVIDFCQSTGSCTL